MITLHALHLAVLLLSSSPAQAASGGTPDVSTAADHETTGRVIVAANADMVRAFLADPTRVASVDSGPAQVEVEDEGSCKLIRTIVTHPLASIRYRSRQCPNSSGFRTELVESTDLTAFHSEWAVRAIQGGTELIYKVRTIPSIAVPQFLVDRQTRASVTQLLERLKVSLESE